MKLAVMQPYLFPYLGYFQLIHAVDAFVLFDDVNYIKRGWINRNNILNQGKEQMITLEVSGGSQNRLINQVGVGGQSEKFLKNIYHAYAKAPRFSEVYPLLEQVLLQSESNLARYLENILRKVCEYLWLEPAWYSSSALTVDRELRGEDRIINMCSALGSTQYINLPGGRDLYSRDKFAGQGIKLSFIEPAPVTYPQFGGEFVANLSIIDVMMFNDRAQCRQLLNEYRIDG